MAGVGGVELLFVLLYALGSLAVMFLVVMAAVMIALRLSRRR